MARTTAVLAGAQLLAATAGLVHRPGAGTPHVPRVPSALVGHPATAERAHDLVTGLAAALARHAAAVVRGDRAGFLAGLATDGAADSRAYRTAQDGAFTALRALPLASFSYRLPDNAATLLASAAGAVRAAGPTGAGPTGAGPTGARRTDADRPMELTLPVTVRYQLAGFDHEPAQVVQVLTVREEPAGWRLVTDDRRDAAGEQTQRDVWDFGPLVATRGQRVLVLSHPASALLAASVAAEADRDIPDVTAVWGPWAARAVIEVPDTRAELSALLGSPLDLSRVAAVQRTELVSGASGPHGTGDRVLVNPATFDRLSVRARRVVITHELTHVASRADTSPSTPLWLVEGLADYVGFAHAGVPTRAIGAELSAVLAATGLPAALPTDAAFSPADPNAVAAYEEGWTACRLIARQAGQSALIRVYKQAGLGGDAETSLSQALGDVLHESLPTFVARWRALMRSDFG